MRRESWIDSCRFLAIFVIMFTHFLAMYHPAALSLWEGGPSWWLLGGLTGKFSVAFFFVLLGYFASKPKSFRIAFYGSYCARRYFQFAFYVFCVTFFYLIGSYAVTWLFHTPDEYVFHVLSDGPRYNLIYLLHDAFLFQDNYNATLWCMPQLFLASLVPTMVITDDRASLRLLTASSIIAVEFAANPTDALTATSSRFASIPVKLTRIISFERFIKNSLCISLRSGSCGAFLF